MRLEHLLSGDTGLLPVPSVLSHVEWEKRESGDEEKTGEREKREKSASTVIRNADAGMLRHERDVEFAVDQI